MRIAEAFCKMRLSDFCTSQDIDRAIAVTVDSFVGSQKISAKKALARAFAKYVFLSPGFAFQIGRLLMVCRYTLKRPQRQGPKGVARGGNAVAR
jgi:hypothetical protein